MAKFNPRSSQAKKWSMPKSAWAWLESQENQSKVIAEALLLHRQKVWDERTANKPGQAIANLDLPEDIQEALHTFEIDTIEELAGCSLYEIKEILWIDFRAPDNYKKIRERIDKIVKALESKGLALEGEGDLFCINLKDRGRIIKALEHQGLIGGIDAHWKMMQGDQH